MALRLDAFDNSYFASNHSLQNTTQATDQDFLTLTATPLALSHAIIATGSHNTVSTTVSAYFNVAKDGSSLAEVNREAPNAAGWQDAGLAQRATLTAVATTWKWRRGRRAPAPPSTSAVSPSPCCSWRQRRRRRAGGTWRSRAEADAAVSPQGRSPRR